MVERKSSTLKQKRNNESVKYVMENIFQILSTSSCTQIVLLYSLGSFTLLCKADCALCKHKSPSEQILCMLSHLYALMQQQHSAHCCCFFLASFSSSWVAVLFAGKWDQRIEDLTCTSVLSHSLHIPSVGSGWHTLLCRPAPIPVCLAPELPDSKGALPISKIKHWKNQVHSLSCLKTYC